MSRHLCPLCGSESHRILYLGAPMKLCSSVECSCVFGWWEWVIRWFPVTDGESWAFVAYERGRYWPALWAWLSGRLG